MINTEQLALYKAQCAADLQSIAAGAGLPLDVQRERVELLAELLKAAAVAERVVAKLIDSPGHGTAHDLSCRCYGFNNLDMTPPATCASLMQAVDQYRATEQKREE